MLDPAPRVVLDPELGLVTAGRNAAEADVTAEIYRHTIDVILRADALERWQALSPAEIFAVEYWSLEQAKLAVARAAAGVRGRGGAGDRRRVRHRSACVRGVSRPRCRRRAASTSTRRWWTPSRRRRTSASRAT